MQIYFPAYVENKATGSASLGYDSELLMDLNIINHTYPHLLHVGLTIYKYKPFVWGYSLYHNLNFGPKAILSPMKLMALGTTCDQWWWTHVLRQLERIHNLFQYLHSKNREVTGLAQGYPALGVCVFKTLFLEILFQSFISPWLCGSQRPFPEVDSQEDSGNS